MENEKEEGRESQRDVTMIVSRYGHKSSSKYTSVEDAAFNGVIDIQHNEACPLKIFEGSELVWENTGPFDGSYNRLLELANWEEDDD